uniref:NADH-ubiquinone oxidoreductase chain 6 n=2 Tax=Corallina officinalis TaxID=35170 RepID=A0A6M3WA37_COROI|nr:NADH dehydrogenase subunit 6 [Corallina officinalis]
MVKYNLAKVVIEGSSPFFRFVTNMLKFFKMNIETLIFYFFGSFSIISAIMVVTLSNAVHSVLFLIVVFCNVAGLLLVLGAEFFSFMFLIVYVGAIAVLFLFVVMMLNIKTNPIKIDNFSTIPIGMVIFLILISQIISSIDNHVALVENNYLVYIPWLVENNYLSNIEVIGTFLYTKFCILFLVCGLILLVAMIGAIVLTMHQRSIVKKQQISTQLIRDPRGVIKFIKLRK